MPSIRTTGVRTRGRSAGQVLPAAIFLLLACAGFLYWTVNSGQMVSEKMRLTHAADTAAYSAGVVHARALNYDAYTNRAIVANQVAIAQALSLTSWADYFTDVFCNIWTLGSAVGGTAVVPDDVQRWAQLFAVAFGGAVAQIYTGSNACKQAIAATDKVNIVTGIAITAFDGVSTVLAASQRTLHVPMEAVLIARSHEAAQRAVELVDGHMSVEIVPVSYEPASLGGTFVQLRDGDDRSRLREVVLASRDAFTARREWTVRNTKSPQGNRIDRRGGTTLTDLDNWSAADSMVHGYWRMTWKGWKWRSDTIGNGTATIGDEASSKSEVIEEDYDFDAQYSGLPAIHDLRNIGTDTAASRAGVSVRVEKHRAATLTSQHAAQAGPSGRLAVFDAAAAPSAMAALARAQVIFDRPPRADGRTEYASLYSPFWQVRLVPPTSEDRLYSATRQGNLALPGN